jgi:hypothetical protein
MRWYGWVLWLIGLSAVAQPEVKAVRTRLTRARAGLSSPKLTEDERRTLESRLNAAERALDAYVRVVTRGDKRAAATAPLYAAGGAVLADDVTGVGAADDPLLPIIGLGVLLAHAATSPPATDSEINKAWIALVAAMEAASATAVELARKKKAGCSCRCLKPGVGPGIGAESRGRQSVKKLARICETATPDTGVVEMPYGGNRRIELPSLVHSSRMDGCRPLEHRSDRAVALPSR